MTTGRLALRLGILAATVGAGLVAAGPAEAAVERTYLKSAAVSLVELGPMSGAPGNAHYGYLSFVDGGDSSAVYGYIFHFDCPTSYVVDRAADFDAASASMEAACTMLGEGTQSSETDGGVDIRMTKDQTWTHVEGSFESQLAGQPTIAFSLNLYASASMIETNTETRSRGVKTFTRTRTREAMATGSVGDIGIGDEGGEVLYPAQVTRTLVKQVTWPTGR